MLVQSHTLSRIVYFNVLYANANKGDNLYLQKVLNRAVRFIYILDKRTCNNTLC